ncbi:hypothetical protein L3X38_016949 [Prunus dulcis]|uniref:Reverse transcriptase Ty1/copia-type domain-containing protein n=1 Tax=Prunus dulcis TaxID=3755 RepID=A0AAD4W768_PRUDU|nr:hypothetical protein L3X38_016949 [Prunus dulcis]
MLEDLLEKKVIKLPECKRPEEMNRVNDPKFCKYHRIVSHPVEKCFVLKELIMNLARQGRIELDVDEIADANVATKVFGSFDPVPLPALLKRLEFQSTRGIHQVTDPCTKEVAGKPNNQGGDGFVGDSFFDDNEGWTLVTRWKPRTKRIPQRQNTQSKRERRKKSSHKCSKTKTRIMVKRDSGQESGPLIQEPRIPITLEEYFPKMFFVRGPTKAVHMTTCYQVDDKDVLEGRFETHEEKKVLTQVEDSPSHFNIEEAVELPEAIRIALVPTKISSDIIILTLFVDDIILTCSNSELVNFVIHDLGEVFELKDMGQFKFFLGLEVQYQADGKMFVNQAKYPRDLIKKAAVGANFPTRIFAQYSFVFSASLSPCKTDRSKRTTPGGCWPKALRCLS